MYRAPKLPPLFYVKLLSSIVIADSLAITTLSFIIITRNNNNLKNKLIITFAEF